MRLVHPSALSAITLAACQTWAYLLGHICFGIESEKKLGSLRRLKVRTILLEAR